MDTINENRVVEQQVVDKESQLGIALELKNNMLKRIEFVPELPKMVRSGTAEHVSKRLQTSFSINSPAKITGNATIDKLNGRFRLPLAKVNDIKYYLQKVRVTGEISVQQGEVIIYSPMDTDFWQMAAIFVDHKEKYRPNDYDLTLKGYNVYRAKPGAPAKFSAELLAIGPSYYLLLETDAAEKISITLEG